MIVTVRARLLLLFASLVAAAGSVFGNPFAMIVALTMLVWIFVEWICFRIRIDLYLPSAKIGRKVSDRQGNVRCLWVDRPAEVVVTIRFQRNYWLPSSAAEVSDILPPILANSDAQHCGRFLLGGESTLTLRYSVRPTGLGTARLHGLRFVLTDLHGFFLAERFLSLPQSFRVMPLAAGLGPAVPIRKHSNRLSPPGIHSVASDGIGSELLEIRDYVPGDPPRSIAWKVSARRGELMSKRFESEVPVRCQLFVDNSRTMHLGYPGASLANVVFQLAAVIARTLASHRDPVGLQLFDANKVSLCQPSANRKSVLRMIDMLCTAIDQPMSPVAAEARHFLRPAYDVARICYPQQLAASWAFTRPWNRHKTRLRRQLSAILTDYYQLGPFGMAELVEHDVSLSQHLQRFLADHQAPYLGPTSNRQGKQLLADGDKVWHLAKLLRMAVAKGRDNELFVLMVELFDTEFELTPLLKSIQLARAKHHRVMVVAAWPPGAAIPEEHEPRQIASSDWTPETFAIAMERRQKSEAYLRLERLLAKVGASCVAATDQRAPVMILNQLELLRSGRIGK